MAPSRVGTQRYLLSGIMMFLVGIVLGSTSLPTPLLAGIVSCCAFGVALAVGRFHMLGIIVLFALTLGIALSLFTQSRTRSDAQYFSTLHPPLTARVVSFPNNATPTTFIIQDDISGLRMRVSSRLTTIPVRGDNIVFNGELSTLDTLPHSYATYLRAHHISGVARATALSITRHSPYAFWTLLSTIREGVTMRIARALPQNEGAFLTALLLGSATLPDALAEDFKVSGLQHIIAVSGTHVTLLAICLGFVARATTLPRLTAQGFLLLILASYILLVGAPASAVRAGVMGGAGVLAIMMRRRAHAIRLLLYALVGICIASPLALTGDVGLQLSLMAMLGMISLAPRIRKRLPSRLPESASTLIAITIGAQIATLPVLLSTFERASPYSFIANILTVPLTPLLFMFAGVAGFGLIFPFSISFFISLPARLLSQYIIAIAHFSATLPYASVRISPPILLLIVLYALVLYFAIKDTLLAFTEVEEDDKLRTKSVEYRA